MIYNPPIGRKNTTYIPLIVLANLGDSMLPIPPIKGTRIHSIEKVRESSGNLR